MLVVLCSAVIAFACAQMLPKKPVTEDIEVEPVKDAESDGAENSAEDAAEPDDADAREGEAPAVEPEFESGYTPDDEAADDDSPAGGDAAGAADADPSSDNAPVIDDDLEDDGPAQGAHFGKSCDDR